MNGACWGVGCKKQGVASLLAWQQRYCFESPQTSYCVEAEGEEMPSSCRKNISNTDRLIKSEHRASTSTFTRAASEHGQVAGTLSGGKKQFFTPLITRHTANTIPFYWESDSPSGLPEFKQAEPISYPCNTTELQYLP